MSPKAYDVESVTAAAPMIEALSSTSAKSGPVPCPTMCSSPRATPAAFVKWPARLVPEGKGRRHQERSGRDHHDERAEDGIGPFVVDPAWRDPLVDDVGLLEEQLPGRNRRSDDGDDQEHRRRGHPTLGSWDQEPVQDRAGVGMDQDHQRDGEEVHHDEDEHETLPAAEAAARRYGDEPERGDGDRDVGRDAEVGESEAHSDELGDDREEIQDKQVADGEGPQNVPNRSLISRAWPTPVTAPSRTTISWLTIRTGTSSGRVHNRLRPKF